MWLGRRGDRGPLVNVRENGLASPSPPAVQLGEVGKEKQTSAWLKSEHLYIFDALIVRKKLQEIGACPLLYRYLIILCKYSCK